MVERTKIGEGKTQPDRCDSLRVIRKQIIGSDVGLLQAACGVERALRYDMRYFMNNDAGNCARENPLAFASGFIPKVSGLECIRFAFGKKNCRQDECAPALDEDAFRRFVETSEER
jgi:hypothetical protein